MKDKEQTSLVPGVGILPGTFRDHITFMEVSDNPDTVTYLKSELANYIAQERITARIDEAAYLRRKDWELNNAQNDLMFADRIEHLTGEKKR